MTHAKMEGVPGTGLPAGLTLSLTAITASLLIGEVQRTPRLLISDPAWYGVLINSLRGAAYALFVSALVVVLSVCIVASYYPMLDKDVASPLLFMATGMGLFILDRALFVPMFTMDGFVDPATATNADRIRATAALTAPQYAVYVGLLVYVFRFILRARAEPPTLSE